MNNKFLNVEISKRGLVFITDRTTGKIWSSFSSAILGCWDVTEKELVDVAAHLNFPLYALLKGTFRSREIAQ